MKYRQIPLAIKLSVIPLILCSLVGGMIVQGSVKNELLYRKKPIINAEGELLVKYTSKTSYAKKLQSIQSSGSVRIREFSSTGYIQVKIADGLSVQKAIDRYASDPDVEAVQPNYIYRALAAPNDPDYASQWGMNNTAQTVPSPSYMMADGSAISNPGTAGCDMRMEKAWDQITDCSSVTVAVLDTGVNYNHEDLRNNMWNGGTDCPNHGYDFTGTGGSDPMDYNGHGTMMAGIIGAEGNNGRGGTGVCWKTKIMAVKVLDAAGNGTTASLVDGINFAAAHGAKVINISLSAHSYDQAVYEAIRNAGAQGVLVIAAAGNDAQNIESSDTPGTESYPCEYDLGNIVCVTALDQEYNLANFSNTGSAKVDLAAPGVNSYTTWAGTTQILNETFSSGWQAIDSNHSGTTGWGRTYTTDIQCPSVKHYCLINPAFNEYYKNNSIDKVYKDFAPFAQTADSIVLQCSVSHSFYDANDSIGIYIKNAPWEPTISDSVKVARISGGTGKTDYALDLTPLVQGKDHFQVMYCMNTDASGSDGSGVMIGEMNISALWLNTTTYTNYSGTSVSAASVSGLAALIFAFNPDYTYKDTIASLYSGGRLVTSLTGKTATGKAADAEGALEYLSAPDGLGAEVQ